jgi:hypothetical protein
MLAEILGPLEEQRPLQSDNKVLATLADINNAEAVKDAEALLGKRIDAVLKDAYDPELFGQEWSGKKRSSVDKREDIAFLLYTIARAKKPDGQPLYPQGLERTEVVVGMNEFTHAADRYALALREMKDRVTRENNVALEGYVFAAGDKLEVLPEFAQKYPEAIKNIQDLRAVIKNREFRLNQLQAQVEQHKKQIADRKAHYDAVSQQLLATRAETARLVADLQKLQREYFAAQRRLSDANELNLQKEQEIRKLESQQKGRTK